MVKATPKAGHTYMGEVLTIECGGTTLRLQDVGRPQNSIGGVGVDGIERAPESLRNMAVAGALYCFVTR